LQKNFVHVAPLPILPRLKRLHDGVLGLVKMLGSVLVLRRVTASDVSANQALPEMHPGIAHFQTLFAALAAGGYLADFLHMSATGFYLSHESPRGVYRLEG
jgi:hypothetical protein